uniref:Small ribosomal subunit protein mS23 conserved domain-containing protein n=1 Tax=Sus scrofa TaxID=9823 RepID=A0A4X1SIU6_PIG
MAGSRLETVGSIFSRTRDLIRAGVLKEKPLWLDIYNARLRYGKAKAAVQDIFTTRIGLEKFYSAYGSGPKAFDLFNPNFKSTCQRFVEKYIELQRLGETDEEKLFVEAGKALLTVSIFLSKLLLGSQQEGSPISRKSEPTGIKPQTAVEENQPWKEVPQDQPLEAPEKESKGLPPP